MSATPLLVAFHQDTELTDGTYADHAKRLRAECKTVGQKASIVKREYGDDYLSICRGKPTFMLEMLDKHDGKDLIYVDVDTTILKAWDAGELTSIAWAVKPNGRPYGHVAYLPNDDDTRAFLAVWLDILEEWEGGDHSAMWVALARTGYQWRPIPAAATFARPVLSDTEATRRAQRDLADKAWLTTVRQRLSE